MGELLPFKGQVSQEPDWTRMFNKIGEDLEADVRITHSEESFSNKQIETKILYPVSHEVCPELETAFKLVSEGLVHIKEAIDREREGDLISSDDAVHRLQALLPELFCCRAISDGFGAIINAVYHSLDNMRGAMLNSAQLQAVNKVLKRIHSEPFLLFDEAVDEIMHLEEVGFEIEPGYYKYAADMLDE